MHPEESRHVTRVRKIDEWTGNFAEMVGKFDHNQKIAASKKFVRLFRYVTYITISFFHQK